MENEEIDDDYPDDDEMDTKKINTSDYKSFHYLENGDINFSVFDTEKTTSILVSGSYILDYTGYPKDTITLKLNLDTEKPKIPTFFVQKEELDEYFKAFFDPKVIKKIKSVGLYHKIGALLHGLEGSGKTSIAKYYCHKLIKDQKAVVFHITNSDKLKEIWTFVRSIRQIQNNPIVIVFDEIDRYMQSYSAIMKTILDGEISINNCIFFGMTNFIDSIPRAIKDRPSRFKYCLEIGGVQDEKVIEQLIFDIIGDIVDTKTIKVMALECKNETLDIIKQRCLDIIMKITQEKTSKRRTVGFQTKEMGT